MRLFVGDDWAEDHHDVELMDEAGRVLARKRLPEGVAGMARLHALIGQQLGEDAEDAEVVIGTETDRGPWVAALVAAGYAVYGVNPLQDQRHDGDLHRGTVGRHPRRALQAGRPARMNGCCTLLLHEDQKGPAPRSELASDLG